MELFADIKLAQVVSTIFYSFLGLGIFILSYLIIDRLTHFSMEKELVEDQNTALGIVLAGVLIALAILISSVIRS